jgi:hypothetical protein
VALATDLLAQATLLAKIDSGKPKQANLRRALSAAYYAIFHLLIDDGSASVGSRLSAAGKAKVRRAFAHADMKSVCSQYAKASLPGSIHAQIAPLLSAPIDPDLKFVAETFVDLQEVRHLADYDLAHKFSRVDVLASIDSATIAFTNWKKVRSSANAQVFLIDLLLRKSWSRT